MKSEKGSLKSSKGGGHSSNSGGGGSSMPDHRKSSHNSGQFSLSSVGSSKKKNVPSSNCISMQV